MTKKLSQERKFFDQWETYNISLQSFNVAVFKTILIFLKVIYFLKNLRCKMKYLGYTSRKEN